MCRTELDIPDRLRHAFDAAARSLLTRPREDALSYLETCCTCPELTASGCGRRKNCDRWRQTLLALLRDALPTCERWAVKPTELVAH